MKRHKHYSYLFFHRQGLKCRVQCLTRLLNCCATLFASIALRSTHALHPRSSTLLCGSQAAIFGLPGKGNTQRSRAAVRAVAELSESDDDEDGPQVTIHSDVCSALHYGRHAYDGNLLNNVGLLASASAFKCQQKGSRQVW